MRRVGWLSCSAGEKPRITSEKLLYVPLIANSPREFADALPSNSVIPEMYAMKKLCQSTHYHCVETLHATSLRLNNDLLFTPVVKPGE
jgi:hypothetical protein